MATILVDGRPVKVSDSFMSLPPEKKQAAIAEIEASMGASAAPAPAAPAAEPKKQPNYEQLMGAARKADAAGDSFAAKRFLELAIEQRKALPPGKVPSTDLPVTQDQIDSPIPTELLQRGSEILRRAETGEPLAELTMADKMRTLGKKSPDPSELNAKAEEAIKDAVAERFVEDNPIGSRVAKFNQGLPFVGQWVDEAQGALLGPEARDYTRQANDAMDRAKPLESAALQTAGGITGSIPLAIAAAPAVLGSAPASLGGRMVAGGASGLVAGATEGAVSGAGANDENRGDGAREGALIGGGIGLGMGALAPAAEAGVRNAVTWIKGTDVSGISKLLGISPQAARAVKEALASEDAGKAVGRLQAAGPNAMLVEGGPSLQAAGDAVAASGGEATRIMREAVDDRVAGGAADVAAAIDKAIPPAAARTKADLGGAYDAAYASPIDYASDAGRAVESYMKRVPRSVLAKARGLIEMDASIPEDVKRQYLLSIAEDGTLSKDALPSVLEVDYVTRALNDVAKGGDGKGALGGNTNEGRIYGALSRNLRNATKDAVPAYGQALDAASTEIGIKNATEFGASLLRPSTLRSDVVETMKGMPAVEREAVRGSVRQYIDDTIATTRRTMSSPDTDSREAMKAVRDLSSRSSRDKLAEVLGKDAAEDLGAKLDEAATAFEIAAALHTNSKTAVRQAVQGSISASAEPGVVKRMLAGEPVQATKRFVQLFTGATPEARSAKEAGIYAEIAKALTQTRGKAAERALTDINKLTSGQALSEEAVQQLARTTVTALSLSGYSAASAAAR